MRAVPAPPAADTARIIKELIHRAGLNADILNNGRISVGDAVVVHERPWAGRDRHQRKLTTYDLGRD